jgi:hypothetical protein
MNERWTKHSRLETYARASPIGLVTVALRSAAGRQKQWTALDAKGRRISTGRDATECMEQADAQIARLAAKEGT